MVPKRSLMHASVVATFINCSAGAREFTNESMAEVVSSFVDKMLNVLLLDNSCNLEPIIS